MPWIEPETVATAKSVDLFSYLTVAEPGNIKRCGQDEWRLKDHDSLKVSATGGKWHWHSRSTGGTTAVQYLIVVRGYAFLEAVQMVLDSKAAPYLPIESMGPPKPFALPPRHENDQRVVQYLCGQRGVSREVVEHCRAVGALYESAHYHSCVFVGYDENHTPCHAAIRATQGDFKQDVEGSDKRYSFALQAKNGPFPGLYVYESAIDALSDASLRLLQGEDWRAAHYLSLAGVSPLPIIQYLKRHPEISEVYLCLDNDEAGRDAAEQIMDNSDLSRPGLEISFVPPVVGKDYNRLLHITRRCRNTYNRPRPARNSTDREV
ncbi:DUF3991 and toprim domain-containing protein [Ruminococcaceae bacterium OttesenSCG-928-D13]|nr:DUF3991 and toprim domain-containing protein [Ruminococcaceae bacterium OttesenSCG-928-D13]